MKLILSSLLCILSIAVQAAPSDSAQAAAYWQKAAGQRLHAPIRQRYLDTALMFEPTNAYFWQQKAMPLFKQQKCEAGMSFLDSAVKYNTELYLPYRAFMKCMFQRNYRDAIVDLNAAKQMDSIAYVMDHPFDFYLSLCYLQLNDLDRADYFIEKCINDRRKKHGTALDHNLHFFYEGIIQMEKENYTEAISSFDVALKIYPRFSDAKYYKAECCLALKEPEKALALFKEALVDLESNYTIAEDNVIHERYPYQIKDRWVKSFIDWMEEKK